MLQIVVDVVALSWVRCRRKCVVNVHILFTQHQHRFTYHVTYLPLCLQVQCICVDFSTMCAWPLTTQTCKNHSKWGTVNDKHCAKSEFTAIRQLVTMWQTDRQTLLITDCCTQNDLYLFTFIYWTTIWYGYSVDNTVENSSIFSLIRLCWLPPARACRQ